jgi:phosphopantetheinyl transferase (holo-ACP synthase)
MKALGRRDEALPWRSIGIGRDERGRERIRLSGPAAELAERGGVRRLDVSLTQRRDVAAAVVVAELE